MSATLRAGTGRQDISNYDLTVHDPLQVKALYLEQGGTSAVILTMDTISIGGGYDVEDGFLPELRRRLEQRTGIPGGHLLVNASHTHTPGRMLCSHAEQLERALAAIVQAQAGAVPVRFGAGRGIERRFGFNRTLRLRDGRQWTVRQSNPCPWDEEVATVAPHDPEVIVWRFDRMDGTPLAVLFNFGCHPLLGLPGHPVTANFPGFAAARLEKELGCGCQALFVQGAGGDVVEENFKDTGVRDARLPGQYLAETCADIWRGIAPVAEEPLRLIRREVAFPRRTDIPARMAALRERQREHLAGLRFTSLNFRAFLPLYLQHALNPAVPGGYGYRYQVEAARGEALQVQTDAKNRQDVQKYLSNLKSMEELAQIEDALGTLQFHQELINRLGAEAPSEILALRLGESALVSSATEMLSAVGMRLKRSSPFAVTMVSAYSNGYLHYGVPAEDYGLGGYESTECNLAPAWQACAEAVSGELLTALRQTP